LDVLFFVGRNTDGSEALSTLASSGELPNVASKYDVADSVNHHVDEVKSSYYVTDLAKEHFQETKSAGTVLEINLSEFNRKLTGVQIPKITIESTTLEKRKYNRAVALDKASIIIVKTDMSKDSAEELDSAVLKAVESENVASVILTAQRSTVEVKKERDLAGRQRRLLPNRVKKNAKDQAHRRLEDAQGDDDGNNEEDFSGVYYVNMTPNIFAGILFTFLFIYVVQVGIGCLGNIQGPPDLYVSKYPSIGREA